MEINNKSFTRLEEKQKQSWTKPYIRRKGKICISLLYKPMFKSR